MPTHRPTSHARPRRGAEEGDRIDRETHGVTRWSAAYWPMLGGAAPHCAPGDYDTARTFVARVERAIERGGWTRNEWRNLHKLYEVWSRRANGQDPRFDLVGVQAGRLPRAAETWIGQRRRIFEMREYLRTANILHAVDAADSRVRPAVSTLRARARQARLFEHD